MGETNLPQDIQFTSPAMCYGCRCPLTDPIDCQDGCFLER